MRLNLACGRNAKDGWVNADIQPRDARVSHVDLTRPFPWSDNSAHVILCEHFLEHLGYPNQARAFLSECLRVLKPRGVLRVGVPDLGDLAAFAEKYPEWCRTNLECTLWLATMPGRWPHRWGYDEDGLALTLQDAGFADVARVRWDAALDSEARRVGTLYMTGAKPWAS